MEAPMSSSLGAMGPLLRKLDLLLAPECRLRRSLKHAIELLKLHLEGISADLVGQSMTDSPSNKAKYWMDEVRDLSYDMEDCIDNMMQNHSAVKARSIHHFKVARLKIGRFPKMLNPSTRITRIYAQKKKFICSKKRITRIAEIWTLLWEASERYLRYQLHCGAMNPRFAFTGAHSPVSALCKTSTDLVGVDDSRKELTDWLTNQEEKQLKVLSIVGWTGVGKTTLARALYGELKWRFECRAFIRVSRKPEMSKLIGDILSQVQWPKETPDGSALQNSINSIWEHLQDKRYLIVIDDLWDATPWDILNNAFPKGNNCSRIIITTEFQDVVAECSSYHSVKFFEMKPLLSQDSEKLFIHRVFGSDHHSADQLRELTCRIINTCGGLPLAVIMMAGLLLASKLDKADLWDQLQQKFPPSLAILTLEEMLEKIVNLCYNSLPQYLKTCLLYLDIYPEGSTVWKVDLLKQWTAEGFVSPTEVIEGVAGSYFDELVSRGMIQPEKVNNNDEVLSCTVHHSVRDLIRRKSSEEKFITANDYSQTITGFPMKVHRLSLHFSSGTYASKPKGIGLSKVRSLAFFGLHRCMPSIMELKHLRVLNLELWGGYEDCTTLNLSGICRLFQLRYLKVRSHIFVELPSEIRGLRFLETLEIDAKVSHIPNDIACLASLLHLSLRDGTKLPDGIGRITSLQTLQFFDLSNNSEDNVRSLGDLINLHDLRITCSEASSEEHLNRNLAALSSSLGRLANLRSLVLPPGIVSMTMFVARSYVMSSISIFLQRLELSSPIFTFTIFPEWIAKLQKLQTLKIIVRVLLQNDIDILAELPVLTSLSLFVRQPASESVVFQSGAFPVLKHFKYRCGALCLVIKDKALPNLERLKLGFNVHKGDKYVNMISGMEYLYSLKEIAVEMGAAAGGAEESDRRSAEFTFKDAIQKHSRFHCFINIKRVDWIEEEQLCLPIPSPGVGCNLAAAPPDGNEAGCSQGEEDDPDPDGAAQDKEWDAAVKLIERWEAPRAAYKLVFESREDGEEYLAAAACLVGASGPCSDMALQAAMARLKKEFRRLLIRGVSPPLPADYQSALVPNQLSLRVPSSSSGKGDDFVGTGGKMSLMDYEISRHLISPDTAGTLRDIADVMVRAGYTREVCQVYGKVRRDMLMECLAVLGVKKKNLERVRLVKWGILEEKIKEWIHALKVVVRLLSDERRICSQILAADANAKECFTKAAQECVLQLLHYGNDIVIAKTSSEGLFHILDMYEALAEVLGELEALFSGEARDLIKKEAEWVLRKLGDEVRHTIRGAKFSSLLQGEEKMKKWIHAVKVVVRLAAKECFTEAAQECVLQLLDILEEKTSSEDLFDILDMYEAQAEVLPVTI